MQSLRLPRSAHPVASAAELAAGPTDLDELIQEAGETAQALSDPKQKAAVKRWLDKLRPLVSGRRAFEQPDEIGTVFVKDAAPLISLLPQPLLALLAATIRAVVDRRARPLLDDAVSFVSTHGQVDDWAVCAGRVLGGATNWQVNEEPSEKELMILAQTLLPTLCNLLFDDALASLRQLQRDIVDLLSVLTEQKEILKYATSLTDGHPALLTGVKFADLLFRFRAGPSAAFLDILDIAARLMPGGTRASAERVAFAESIFGRFRPDIAARAGAEMVKGKMSQWMTVTRLRIPPILAEEGLDVMQPVPLVGYSDRSRDGVNQRHLQSESDQDAIRKGLPFVFIDCDEIHIEGDIDADGNAMIFDFHDILEILVDEEGDAEGSATVMRVRIAESEARFVLASPYHKIYAILSQRPITCAIPPPTVNLPASLRSSKAAEDLRLPDPGQQALTQAAANEQTKRAKKAPGRSAATEARVAVVSQTVQSDSTSSRKTSSTTSGSKIAAAQASSSSSRKQAAPSNAPSGTRAGRPATPPPPPRRTAAVPTVRNVSDLGSELSDDPEASSPPARKLPPSPKRKRRNQPETPDASADEPVDETIVLDKESPQTSPSRKRARAPELSDDESVPEGPETWVPPKPRAQPRTSYSKKAARTKPTSMTSARSSKSVPTALAASDVASVADDTWDDLPGAREIAKPAVKARPKPKPRLKKTSPSASATSKSRKKALTASPAPSKPISYKAVGAAVSDKAQAGSEKPARALPARRAAANAKEAISRGMSEEIEDDSQRRDDEDAESAIEDFTPQDQLPHTKSDGSEKARDEEGAESPAARPRATSAPDDGVGRVIEAAFGSPGSARVSPSLSIVVKDDRMEEPVEETDRMGVELPERDVGSPIPSESGSYGNGMDYEPEMVATQSVHAADEPPASQVMSQSLGEPLAISPATNPVTSAPARLRVAAPRSRSVSPALQVYQDSPRLPSASHVFSRPGALRQPSILSEIHANKTAEQRATQEALPAAQSLGDVSKGKTSLTPWKIQASKAAAAQEAHVRALEEQMQQQLAAQDVDHMDVFDEALSVHDGRQLSMAAFGDAHSTPRAPRRSQTALAADKSFSEPPAGHAQPELEVHPASDNIPSHLSIDHVPRILPVHLQQPTEGRRPTADWAGPRMPAPDAPAPRNVRVLSQPEFIDTEPHYELTAGSAMTANGAAPVAKRPSGAPPQHEPAAIHAAPRGQSAREVASGVGRAAAGSAGPTRRGKAVPSPRSAGLATEAKRHPSQVRTQRASSGRSTDPPQAKALRKLLDSLNDELVDKVARRINGTRDGARDASLEYRSKLTALHRRFAEENKAILARNDEADATLTEELETIAGDLADLRVANQACADEVVALRERYMASYAAQETALADAMASIRLMRRPS